MQHRQTCLLLAVILLAIDARTVQAEDKDKALRDAVRANQIKKVAQLLGSGAGVNGRNEFGQTALHIAAARGYVEIAKLLLSMGADANVKDEDGATPLEMAKSGGHRAMIEILTKQKLGPEPKGPSAGEEKRSTPREKGGLFFTISRIEAPGVMIKLAAPVAGHISLRKMPEINYENIGTNRYERLLIGVEWGVSKGAAGEEEPRVACYIPTSAPAASGTLWTSSWRSLALYSLEQSVAGQAMVRIALFEAIPDGSGHPAGFRYGKQVSNVLEVPVKVERY